MRWYIINDAEWTEESTLYFFVGLVIVVVVAAIAGLIEVISASFDGGQGKSCMKVIFGFIQFFGGVGIALLIGMNIVSIDPALLPFATLLFGTAIATVLKVLFLVLGLDRRVPAFHHALTVSTPFVFLSWAPFAVSSALLAGPAVYWTSLLGSALAMVGSLSFARSLRQVVNVRSRVEQRQVQSFLGSISYHSRLGYFFMGTGAAGQAAVSVILEVMGVSGGWHTLMFWLSALTHVAVFLIGFLLLFQTREDAVVSSVVDQLVAFEKVRTSINWARFTNANRYQESSFYFDLIVHKGEKFFSIHWPGKDPGVLREFGFEAEQTEAGTSFVIPWASLKDPEKLKAFVRGLIPKGSEMFLAVGTTSKAKAISYRLPPSLQEDEWFSNSPSNRQAAMKAKTDAAISRLRTSGTKGAAAGGAVGYTAYMAVTEEEASQEPNQQDSSGWL
jgi:hypothetical protein